MLQSGTGPGFYARLTAQADAWLAGDRAYALDDAVTEWLHWRSGVPSRYPNVAAMPYQTAKGFQYLCHSIGRSEGLTATMNANHEAMLTVVQKRVDDILR